MLQQPTYKLLPGQDNEIRFDVINNSPSELQRVSVTDTLPDGVEFVYAAGSTGFHSGSRDVDWLLDLAPNQVRTLSLHVQPQRTGEWSHEVLARGANAPEVSSSAVLRAEGYANLQVRVVGAAQMEKGKTIIYRIAVTNQGSSPATNVQVKALLSEGLAFNHAQGATDHRDHGQQVTFAALPVLNPEAREEFVVGALALSSGNRGLRSNGQLRSKPAADHAR